ncbi:MAG: TRCF domain-containing protein, partial [Planctomycetota bacterium]
MDAYRRISQCNAPDEVEQIRADLLSAYGELPRSAERLLQLAEIRVGAAMIGVRTVVRHERDVIFRTRRPDQLRARFEEAQGTLRAVGTPDAAGLQAMYYRPPESYH